MERNQMITWIGMIKYLKSFSDFFFNVSIPELPVFCQFCWQSPFFVRTQSPAFQSHFVINQTNSLKLMSPLPSTSMTLTRSFNSSSVGDHPKVLITLIDISSKYYSVVLPLPCIWYFHFHFSDWHHSLLILSSKEL